MTQLRELKKGAYQNDVRFPRYSSGVQLKAVDSKRECLTEDEDLTGAFDREALLSPWKHPVPHNRSTIQRNCETWRSSPVLKPRGEQAWRIALGDVDIEIDRAADDTDSKSAIKRLEVLLEGIDDASAHAEARIRRLARKLPNPKLAAAPTWLIDQIGELKSRDVGNVTHEPTIRTAVLLIRNLLATVGDLDGNRPALSLSSTHTVEVEWQSRLTWIVYPAQLSWPAVHVRVYGSRDGEPERAKSFWYANSVTEHSAPMLNI